MKSFKHYIFIIAISALPFVSLFSTPLAPHTHDSPVHFARMAAYYKALVDGQILPRWAGELNYGYGMPLFNFIYPLPYLITSLPLSLGAGLVLSFKIALILSFILSGVFMYLFTVRFLKNNTRALIATLLYQFAPFHLVDLLVRGDLAEGLAIAFLPLVLYAVTYGFEEKNTRHSIMFTGLTTFLLITSHNSMSLVFFGIAALFALIFAPEHRKRLQAFLGLIAGLTLSAFYWLPAIVERKFTYGDLFMKDMFLSHFAPIQNFFLPNFTNAENLQTGGIAVSFGLIQVIVLLIAIVSLIKKSVRDRNNRSIIWFSLAITAASLFVMQPMSTIFWTHVPILRMFQFPWRFLNVVTFALALLGGIVLIQKRVSSWYIAGLALIIIGSSLVYFRPPLGFDPINEPYYWNYPLNTTYFGETDVIWSAGPAGSYPENRFEVIGGDGTIENPVKRQTIHTFTVNAQTDVQVVDRTQYFPGWRVYSDGKKIPVEFQDQNWRGLITFRLTPGIHVIRVVWENSPVRSIAIAISILSAFSLLGLLFAPKRLFRMS